jgi:hypothetical protein
VGDEIDTLCKLAEEQALSKLDHEIIAVVRGLHERASELAEERDGLVESLTQSRRLREADEERLHQVGLALDRALGNGKWKERYPGKAIDALKDRAEKAQAHLRAVLRAARKWRTRAQKAERWCTDLDSAIAQNLCMVDDHGTGDHCYRVAAAGERLAELAKERDEARQQLGEVTCQCECCDRPAKWCDHHLDEHGKVESINTLDEVRGCLVKLRRELDGQC